MPHRAVSSPATDKNAALGLVNCLFERALGIVRPAKNRLLRVDFFPLRWFNDGRYLAIRYHAESWRREKRDFLGE
jgi:hypothetical protein